jgi:hypothetical protein
MTGCHLAQALLACVGNAPRLRDRLGSKRLLAGRHLHREAFGDCRLCGRTRSRIKLPAGETEIICLWLPQVRGGISTW